jgi:hypothetical protein
LRGLGGHILVGGGGEGDPGEVGAYKYWLLSYIYLLLPLEEEEGHEGEEEEEEEEQEQEQKSIHPPLMRYPQPRLAQPVLAIKIGNPPLLAPLSQVQAGLIRVQRGSVNAQVGTGTGSFPLGPAVTFGTPDCEGRSIGMSIGMGVSIGTNRTNLPLSPQSETTHPAPRTEIPVDRARETGVIRQGGGGRWRQQAEITRRVGETQVEEGHLLTRAAVTLAQADRGRWW